MASFRVRGEGQSWASDLNLRESRVASVCSVGCGVDSLGLNCTFPLTTVTLRTHLTSGSLDALICGMGVRILPQMCSRNWVKQCVWHDHTECGSTVCAPCGLYLLWNWEVILSSISFCTTITPFDLEGCPLSPYLLYNSLSCEPSKEPLMSGSCRAMGSGRRGRVCPRETNTSLPGQRGKLHQREGRDSPPLLNTPLHVGGHRQDGDLESVKNYSPGEEVPLDSTGLEAHSSQRGKSGKSGERQESLKESENSSW